MEHYAGIDVSLESASVCIVDATGRIVRWRQGVIGRAASEVPPFDSDRPFVVALLAGRSGPFSAVAAAAARRRSQAEYHHLPLSERAPAPVQSEQLRKLAARPRCLSSFHACLRLNQDGYALPISGLHGQE